MHPHPPLRPAADPTYDLSIEANATSVAEPIDRSYGNRLARVTGPAGNQWPNSTHIEDLTPDEIPRAPRVQGEG